MIDDVKAKIETITSENGYAVFPSRVVVLESANGTLTEQPARTVAIVADSQGCCGVFLCVPSPGGAITEASLRQNIATVLEGYSVDPQGEGLPMLVTESDGSKPNGVRVGEPVLNETDNPTEAEDATAKKDTNDRG